MRLVLDVAWGLVRSIVETLPQTEDECGPFVGGLAWGVVLVWATILGTTWLAGGGR